MLLVSFYTPENISKLLVFCFPGYRQRPVASNWLTDDTAWGILLLNERMTLWEKLYDYQTSIGVKSIILLASFSNPNFSFFKKKFSSLDSTILAFCEILDFKSSSKYFSCFGAFSWWWFGFAIWLTDERRLALFPAGTIARDFHHRESATLREQGLNLHRTWVQA